MVSKPAENKTNKTPISAKALIYDPSNGKIPFSGITPYQSAGPIKKPATIEPRTLGRPSLRNKRPKNLVESNIIAIENIVYKIGFI